MTASSAALLAAVIALAAAARFGYLRAQMVRAGADYRGAKAAVKPARTTFLRSIRQTITSGVAVGIVLGVLLVWVARDARDNDTPVRPSPTSSSAPLTRRRTRHRAGRPARASTAPQRPARATYAPPAGLLDTTTTPGRTDQCAGAARGPRRRHRPPQETPVVTPGDRTRPWRTVREAA